jgi:hypothetical protein
VQQIKEVEMDGTLARIREMKNTYSILVGKPEGKRLFGRSKHREGDMTGLMWLRIGFSGELL